jgi:hypothetical protein
MQTFFIIYNTGEYDSYCDRVYAIDAESKEALYEEINRSCDEYIKIITEMKNNRKDIEEQYRPKNIKTYGQKDWSIYNRMLNSHFDKYKNIDKLSVYDCLIAPFDELFGYYGKEAAIKNSCLNILTIEEYIDYRRAEKIK